MTQGGVSHGALGNIAISACHIEYRTIDILNYRNTKISAHWKYRSIEISSVPTCRKSFFFFCVELAAGFGVCTCRVFSSVLVFLFCFVLFSSCPRLFYTSIIFVPCNLLAYARDGSENEEERWSGSRA